MRIVAGRFGGVRLAALGKGDAGAHLRPTADRVRESLFSALASRPDDPVDGAQVLDLFAGTGALGLEALSRGAHHAVFVDSGRTALRLLRENIAKTRCEAEATIITKDATRLTPGQAAAPATLVFLDPPYGKSLGNRALATAVAGGWIAHGALIVWEESTPQEPPQGFRLDSARRYGDTHITLMSANLAG
ncbi:16S rRNA (guanine(966)-N(2))-methyltransferase RsmD [Rhodobacteraceae bacterium SC52]|nr:16S rRNA (guanine(966)-N(2))-methyltransferase RsmD [Rhodobacteraceae bacterium SC52]